MRERIAAELEILRGGGQDAIYVSEGPGHVLYRAVPVIRIIPGLPEATNVVVPVPGGYPGAMIDLAGLPVGSPLLGRVKGAPNGPVVSVAGENYQIVSYHPHGNAGGPPWDSNRHGFHTYFDWILTWLSCVN